MKARFALSIAAVTLISAGVIAGRADAQHRGPEGHPG